MDNHLPRPVKYWLNSSKNDCFFNVGPPTGPNERIGAIKIILMGHSETMRRMLEDSDMAEKGDISLPDIEPKSFKDFLKCVYGGSDVLIKYLTFEECAKLLYIAEKYLVADVKEKVLAGMAKMLPLSIDNLFVALRHPVCFQDHILSSAISQVITNETDKIFVNEGFLDISIGALLLIVTQDSLNSRELDIFKAMIKWATNKTHSNDGKIIRACITKPLQFIRFRAISCEEFCREIIPLGVMSAEEACAMCVSIANTKPHELSFFSENDNLRSSKVLQKGIGKPLVCSFNVEYISSNEDGQQTPYSIVKEYIFRLSTMKTGDDLSLFLELKHEKHPRNTSWECNVSADVFLVNQFGRTDYKISFSHIYNASHFNWGFSGFHRWTDVVDPSKGYIKHGSFVVAAYVTVKKQ